MSQKLNSICTDIQAECSSLEIQGEQILEIEDKEKRIEAYKQLFRKQDNLLEIIQKLKKAVGNE